MDAMSSYLKELEGIETPSETVIRGTRMRTVLRKIMKLEGIPREDELHIKERAKNLRTKWDTIYLKEHAADSPTSQPLSPTASQITPLTVSPTASPTTPPTAPSSQTALPTVSPTALPPLVIDLTGLSDSEQSPQPPNHHGVKKRTNQNMQAKAPSSKAPFTSRGLI